VPGFCLVGPIDHAAGPRYHAPGIRRSRCLFLPILTGPASCGAFSFCVRRSLDAGPDEAGVCRQKPGHFSNIGLPSRLAIAKLLGWDNCGVLFNASRCRKASELSGPDRYRSNDLARPIFHRPMRGAGLVACGCRSRAVRQCSSSSPGIRFNRRSRHPPLYCGMAATQSNGFEIQIDIR
jgi:hypothetical protein